jgi:hypothetical protein
VTAFQATNQQNGNFQLDDAFVKYAFDNNWDIRFGQFKLPFMAEDLIGDAYQQSVDRSFMADTFGSGFTETRSQGIQVTYQADTFRVIGMFGDGWRSANTYYNNPNQADYALTLRVDGKFAGDWNQWNQFSSWQNSQFAAFLGGAIHWQQGGATGDGLDPFANPNHSNFGEWTVDGQIKGNGWNVFASVVGSYARQRSSSGNFPPNNLINTTGSSTQQAYGWQIQGGWFATSQIEIFGRYDGVHGNNSVGGVGSVSPKTWNFLDFGANYYLFPESETAKISADVVIGLNKDQNLQSINFQGNAATGQYVPGSYISAPNAQAGVLGSPKSGEVALRFQFQLLF